MCYVYILNNVFRTMSDRGNRLYCVVMQQNSIFNQIFLSSRVKNKLKIAEHLLFVQEASIKKFIAGCQSSVREALYSLLRSI